MPKDASPLPRVTIALCTYNGAAYLGEQLGSYLAQEHRDWDLWVSDDGSEDGTLEILRDFQAAHGREHDIRIIEGPRLGSATNFLSLLCHPEFPKGPVALSDQDDIWRADKLRRALEALSQATPLALYGARSFHTDSEMNAQGLSVQLKGRTGFGNALVQNMVSGHTATLSADALALVRRAGVPVGLPYHDWWLYQLVSGAGGVVLLDNEAVVYYRQHHDNAHGANQGLGARLRRIRQVFGKTYRGWFLANTRALGRVKPELTPQARDILRQLNAQPARIGLARPMLFARLDIRRQGHLGTLALLLAAAMGRL